MVNLKQNYNKLMEADKKQLIENRVEKIIRIIK